ncbi:hypothetical protein [Phyllobacterium endophyticum]|uniref:hypothetical protein n=1 Tax=Phyllobacterium endophyticum TaxID=1149773 RepID=UPI001FDF425F|nr:hypothetical protein [Phyllobacterium endophyticum]
MPDKDYSNQHRLLWNIKANEVLIEALKRSPQSDYNCRWLARLRDENAELKGPSTLYEPFQIWYRKYNPDQPRVSAGNPDGGQWTDGGGGGGGGQPLTQEAFDQRSGGPKEKPDGTGSRGGRFGGALPAKTPDTGAKAPDGTPVQPVQGRGGGRRGGGAIIRNIAGRNVEITPEQAVRLDRSGREADNAIGRVRQRDPNWQPRPGAYEGVEGAIRYNEFRAREAEGRIQELNREVFGHNGGPALNNAPPSRHRELLEVPLPRPNRPQIPPVAAGAPDPGDEMAFKRPNDKLQKHDRIDLSRFNERVKIEGETAFRDPKSSYFISRDKAATDAHDGVWKLLDRLGNRIGTITEDGRFLRKMRMLE